MAAPLPPRRRKRAVTSVTKRVKRAMPSARAVERANPNASFKRTALPTKGRLPDRSAPAPQRAVKKVLGDRISIPTPVGTPRPIGDRPTKLGMKSGAPVPGARTNPMSARAKPASGRATAPGQFKKGASIQSARPFAPGIRSKSAPAPQDTLVKRGMPGARPSVPARASRLRKGQ